MGMLTTTNSHPYMRSALQLELQDISERILIVDDHALVRHGLRRLLEEHGYSVVGEADRASDALLLLRTLNPDIVILDIGLPGIRGIELAKELLKLRPTAKIIFLTVHSEEEYVHQALAIGVAGYVLKDSLDTEIVDAIRLVSKGRMYLTPLISKEVVTSFSKERKEHGRPISDQLTNRQREVLSLLCEGKTNKEIAQQLFISARTAEHHRQSLMKRLKVTSIADLIKFAIKTKLVDI